MRKLGLMMAATMAATMMGATAHATVFDFSLTTPSDTYTFALDDVNERDVFLGYNYGAVLVTSSSGVDTVDVSTFLGGSIHSSEFSFFGQSSFTTESQSGETFDLGTYSGTDGTEALTPETLVITNAAAVSAAPEPGVWALMLAGVAMIGLTLRQGRRQRATILVA